jgi:membrane-bound lytic murein transglycosylase D
LHKGALATWTAWVAPRTLKPAEAAKLTGMGEAQLREINLIPPRMLVKTGSTLLVPRAAHTLNDVTEHLADNAMMSLAPEARPQRRVSFKVGKQGSSVAAVARRYRVSNAQVAQWNQVSPQAMFKAGQVVVVMLPAAATAPSKSSVRSPSKTKIAVPARPHARPATAHARPARKAR